MGQKDQISQTKLYSNSEVFWTEQHTFAQVELFLNSKSPPLLPLPTTTVDVKHNGNKAFLLWKAGKSIGSLTMMPLDSCRSKEVPCSPLQTGIQLPWEKKKTWGVIIAKVEGTVTETQIITWLPKRSGSSRAADAQPASEHPGCGVWVSAPTRAPALKF